MTPPLSLFPSSTQALPVTPLDAWVKCKMQQETRGNNALFDLTNGSPFVICIRQTLSGFYGAARPPARWGGMGGRRKRVGHVGRFGRAWEDAGRKEGRGEEKDNSCHNIRISTMASAVASPHHQNITLHTATRRLVGLLVSGQKRLP